MESAMPLPEEDRRPRHSLQEVLFTSPWMAMAIPLLVPLVVLFF